MGKDVDKVRFHLNGRLQDVSLHPKATLLGYLRDEVGLLGTKSGCAQGHCGTCTVLVNGKAELACIYRMDRLEGATVETIENLTSDGDLHPIQQAFVDSGAVQCGFCIPGMVMATKGLLDKNLAPTEDEIRASLNRSLCRCGNYPKAIQAVQDAAETIKSGIRPPSHDWQDQSRVVGASIPKINAPDKASGTFVYGDDQSVEGMIFAKVVWSEFPYAEILSIDSTEAEKSPGVLAVLTAKDIPGRNLFGTIQPDQPVLCDTVVRYVGDAIAVVIAESEKQAAAAVGLVKVDYRELQGVFSPEEALAEDAPKLHEQGNLHGRQEINHGDIEAAFAGADVIVEDTYSTPFIEHAFLEPESGLALFDDDGTIIIKMASQFVRAHQAIVAESLGLPPEKVNIKHVQPGGSFGAKNDISLHIFLGLAALKTGRPVKMTLTRLESMRSHPKRHAITTRLKLGATKKGKLLALQADIVADTGAYASEGIVVLGQTIIFCGGPYVIPNVNIVGTTVYTNNPPAGAMRGFGLPQMAFGTELMMDKLAHELDIDPFDLRLMNAVEKGSVTIAGQTLKESVPMKETIQLAREALKDLPPEREGWKRGVGVACSYKNVGIGLALHLDDGGAELELTKDGNLLVRIGGVELGQGSNTAIAQIAAHSTDVPYGRVQVSPVDAIVSPDGSVTSGSRTTYVSGNAVTRAGAKLRKQMIEYAAHHFGRDPGEVIFEDGLFSTGDGSSISLQKLAQAADQSGTHFTADHIYEPPVTHGIWQHGPPDPNAPTGTDFFFSYSYATQVAVVDVDERLGQVEVLKIIAAHDVGKAINPLALEAQIEGSCLMGMGYALTEEFILDRGRLVSDNLKKLHLPTFKRSPEIVSIIVEDEEPTGPFGAKGVAEAAAVPTAPAIINAVRNAAGITIRDLPATPMKVLDALHDQLEEETA